jgi:hypothetical protein
MSCKSPGVSGGLHLLRAPATLVGCQEVSAVPRVATKPYQLAAYYVPNYHVDPRNEAPYGPGWTEWELVRGATARFPGHRQPKVPLWGYEDESDPAVFARKIDEGADHGIDCFLFDWYWYDDGPFLNRALERGFMQAGNTTACGSR